MQGISWHSRTIEGVVSALKTKIDTGLRSEQVLTLTKLYGKNVLPEAERFTVLKAVVDQFTNALSIVLLLALAATLFLGEYLDGAVIAIALLLNVCIGVLQEGKSAHVFETLEDSQEHFATVLRDGEKRILPTKDLVPGDIVFLEGGGIVPADMRLTTAVKLSINESALTGEWVAVSKSVGVCAEEKPLTDRTNMVWMSTLVSSGYGTGIVVATGSDAQIGHIAHATRMSADHTTPLQDNIRRLAHFLVTAVIVAVGLIMAIGLWRGEAFGEMLLVAIAIAVAAMPTGLPAAVTVTLALGMEAIMKKGGLVRNLLAAETLGTTTIILTDKTGTLTKGRMTLRGLYAATHEAVGDLAHADNDTRELLQMAVLSSDAFVVDGDGKPEDRVHGRPLEKAIVAGGIRGGISQDTLAQEHTRLDFMQFESSRRYSISLNTHPLTKKRVYLSGAPEALLAGATHYLRDGSSVPLTDNIRNHFIEIQKRLSAEGMRFTAIAFEDIDAETIPEKIATPTKETKNNFVFGGLLAFADAVREDVAEEIRVAITSGVRVIMVTGDFPETAKAIATQVGIGDPESTPYIGTRIADMKDDELLATLREHSIFSRVLPQQKLRITRILRNAGEVVAMTGDGVNDAPALVAADIGIAVGSGTEVAKHAADIVLIENSFGVITAAIKEGRRALDNLRKIIAYLLSTSFSEIMLIGGSLLFGAPLPLLPAQILWANIIEEGMMSFPFAFEPASKNIMRRKPERSMTAVGGTLLPKEVKKLIVIVGVVTGALLLGLYFFLLRLELPIEEVRTIMFVALSLDSIFFAFSFKDLRQPLFRISLFSNRYLIGALITSIILLVAAISFAPLRTLLSLTTLSFYEMVLLGTLGIINLFVIEVTKHLLLKREK